jgi:uncharacterized integral membrane protein (TIGR00698 family)
MNEQCHHTHTQHQSINSDMMTENDHEQQESIEQTDIEHQAVVDAAAAAGAANVVVAACCSSHEKSTQDDDAVVAIHGEIGSSANSTTTTTKKPMEQLSDRSATPAMSSDSDDDKTQQQQQQQHDEESTATVAAETTRSTLHCCPLFCCCCCCCCCRKDSSISASSIPPRVQELYTSPDWWSLWIGLFTFLLGIILVFCVPYEQGSDRVKYVIPQPMKWSTNPLDAWDVYNIVGTILLLLVFCAMYLVSCKFMGKLIVVQGGGSGGYTSTTTTTTTRTYIIGFATMATLATISFWIGSNEWCDEHGLGYAIWAIVLGMFVTNCCAPLIRGGTNMVDDTLSNAAKDGEFFIKCSLVLLAVQLDELVKVGVPGIAVAWIGSPLAIFLGYIIGTRCLKCNDALALLISVGAAWCGASAISAVAPIVAAKSEDVSLAISVVAFFTLAFTFIQPYFAMAVRMDESVAGAWIGASVDQTGNVIVSAAIISEKATEVAAIIKMVLNSGLGIMASVIACWWNSRVVEGEEKKPFSLIMLCM